MAPAALSPEIVSLVHHLELNKSGWWHTAAEKIVLAALWQSQRSLTPAELLASLRDTYHLAITEPELRNRLHTLLSRREVIAQVDASFKLAETAKHALDAQVSDSTDLTHRLRSKAASLISPELPESVRIATWSNLYEDVLSPWIRSAGAYAYRLLAGPDGPIRLAGITAKIETFLARYPREHRDSVRAAVEAWLSSNDSDLRRVVLQTLNTYFVLQASQLDEDTLAALAPSGSSRPTFNLFVDTNLLFSLLGLHENPANDAAESLLQVINELRGRVTVKLFVLATTIDETKRAITARLGPLRNIKLGPNLSVAATDILHGIDRKFADECRKAGVALSPDDFFGPYLNNLIPVLKTRGISFFNTPLESFSTRGDVVDDVNETLEREQKKPPDRRKGYEQVTHDMILWHFVKDRRPAVTESPLDARDWVATIDLAFLGFDEYRCQKERSGIQICIYPTTLVQMLQFWIPRSAAFDAALFGSLGLASLFSDFDPETEGITVRILRALSYFENVENLPPETVKAILVSDSLRQRFSRETDVKKEIDLVREALIEENRKKQAALDAARAENARVQDALKKESARNAALAATAKEHAEAAASARAALEEEVRRSADTTDRLKSLEARVIEQAADRKAETQRRSLRRGVVASVALMAAIVGAFAFVFGAYGYLVGLSPAESGVSCCLCSFLVWMECFFLLPRLFSALEGERSFAWIRSNRKVIWAALFAIALGVIANNVTDWIRSKRTLIQGQPPRVGEPARS